jgi:polyribonucleotide 5'-hydroxyl-kinase
MAPTSALPIGASRVVDEMQPVVVDPSHGGSGLLNAVLALLAPVEDGLTDETAVLDSDVIGFLIVCVCIIFLQWFAGSSWKIHSMSIDTTARQMTVLSPGPGSLQGRIALIGSLEWQEQ